MSWKLIVKVLRILIMSLWEDDFGGGTKMSHFEEGEDSDVYGNYTGDETREINGTI